MLTTLFHFLFPPVPFQVVLLPLLLFWLTYRVSRYLAKRQQP
jgi:hypothetical protein